METELWDLMLSVNWTLAKSPETESFNRLLPHSQSLDYEHNLSKEGYMNVRTSVGLMLVIGRSRRWVDG